MRLTIAALLLLSVAVLGQQPKPPAKLVFQATMGPVTFDHAAHLKRAGNCATCHPKLFVQSATAPLNYKGGMHKTAEASQTSCAFCHHTGGKAFAAAGKCAQCHIKATAKPAS